MPGWKGSTRRSRLPKDWPAITKRILRRDRYTCGQCGGKATHVDHIVAGDDHSGRNLRSLCASCHQAKSSAEGGASVHKGRRSKRTKAWREPVKHPGLKGA